MARKAGGGAEFQIDGLDEMVAGLKNLPKVARNRVIRQALRAGAKIVLKQAKDNAPVDTGALKKSIRVRAAAKRKRNVIAIEVRVGEGDFKGDTWYGAAVEYGTSKMPAHPYMTPAYESKRREAAARIKREIADGLDREWRRLIT